MGHICSVKQAPCNNRAAVKIVFLHSALNVSSIFYLRFKVEMLILVLSFYMCSEALPNFATTFYNNKPATKKECLIAWACYNLSSIIHLLERYSTSFRT